MDGGGRVLRSIGEALGALAPSHAAFAFAAPSPSRSSARSFAPLARRREARALRPPFLRRLAAAPGFGWGLAGAFLASGALLGAVYGGEYAAFVARNGSPADVAARMAGLGIEAVVITGAKELSETEIIAAAGIDGRGSLPFADVAAMRDRLLARPLVREASVRKLYPNRLLIEVAEREPFALWQKDGRVMVVAADGAPIEEATDGRFLALPFVVGAGANARIREFFGVVDALGDLRAKVSAGVLVGERRWSLKMANGLDVKLPEDRPEAAAAQFARLARDARLLDKDLVSIDMRVPGRLVARLSEEAAAAREAANPKAKKPGAPVL